MTDQITNNKIVNIAIKLLAGFMVLLVISCLGIIIYEVVTNPSQFNNTQFGIFDFI